MTIDGGQGVLSAMITPAVLISASGTLIFSTSTRLGRIVDRVRALHDMLDALARGQGVDFVEERRAEAERQLHSHAERSRLIQGSLTSFYFSLGLFVGTTNAIVLAALLPVLFWLPTLLGIAGTLALFHGSVLLIAETRLALRSVDAEMEFIVKVNKLRQARRP